MATRIKYQPLSSTPTELVNTHEDWYFFQIKKESSGSVVIGENQELMPVDSGRGISIMNDAWTTMILSPGTILYAASPTNEQIAIIEQVLPLRELLGSLAKLAGALTTPASKASGSAQGPRVVPFYTGGR